MMERSEFDKLSKSEFDKHEHDFELSDFSDVEVVGNELVVKDGIWKCRECGEELYN